MAERACHDFASTTQFGLIPALATMLKLIAAFLVTALTACGHGPQRVTSTRNCPLPQGLPTGKLLLFGEMHGSVEAPKLISDLACSLSKSEEIAIGLEIPSQDQPLIDNYLKSLGTKEDIETLTSGYFWQKVIDGRSSAAMLQLIGDIRALRAEGHAINLFAFDDQPGTKLERNVAIANGIRRFRATHPDTQIIALMGNIHAMQSEMTTSDGVLVPSGSLLHDLDPVSVNITYPAGTIWACMPKCGIQSLTPRSPTTGTGFKLGASFGGYSHSYLLPSITASPPAVPQ